MHGRAVAWFCCCFALLAPASLVAAEPNGTKLLSQGFVAFHQGRYDDAIQWLDQAESFVPRDPRLYIIRGIAKSRSGRSWEGESDIRLGALIEAESGNIQVGRSLQRVQGGERLMVERIRREARQQLALQRRLAPNVAPPSKSPSESQSESSSEPTARVKPLFVPPKRSRPLPQLTLTDDQDDPFRADATGFLGAEPTSPVRPASADESLASPTPAAESPEQDDDAPIGTGIADTDSRADAATADDAPSAAAAPDPFDIDADAPAASQVPASSGGKSSDVLGAVFRAFTRSVTPALPDATTSRDLMQRMSGGAAPAPPPPPRAVPNSDAGDNDPFGPPAGAAAAPTEPAPDAEDPFADEADEKP